MKTCKVTKKKTGQYDLTAVELKEGVYLRKEVDTEKYLHASSHDRLIPTQDPTDSP